MAQLARLDARLSIEETCREAVDPIVGPNRELADQDDFIIRGSPSRASRSKLLYETCVTCVRHLDNGPQHCADPSRSTWRIPRDLKWPASKGAIAAIANRWHSFCPGLFRDPISHRLQRLRGDRGFDRCRIRPASRSCRAGTGDSAPVIRPS